MNPNALTDQERRTIEDLQAYLNDYDAVYASALRRLRNENNALLTEVVTLNLMIDANFCRDCRNSLKQCTCDSRDNTGLCWDCDEQAVPGKLWCQKHDKAAP